MQRGPIVTLFGKEATEYMLRKSELTKLADQAERGLSNLQAVVAGLLKLAPPAQNKE